LPDDEALGDELCGITSCLMGVQQYLEKLKKEFEAGAGSSDKGQP
jgi:hypothetical protein